MENILTPFHADVVIVRYNENIDEMTEVLKYMGFRVKIYEKDPHRSLAPHFVPKNKGNEATGYLKYIIDHYHTLPDHVIFLHAHSHSWHHTGDICDRIQEHVNTRVTYQNLNNFVWNYETIEWFPEYLDWYDTFLYDELGCVQKYGDFMTGHKGCAQFVVHRALIQKRSLQFYQRLYEWLLDTDLEDYRISRYLEYSWHLIWQQVSPLNIWKQRYERLRNVLLCLPAPKSRVYDAITNWRYARDEF